VTFINPKPGLVQRLTLPMLRFGDDDGPAPGPAGHWPWVQAAPRATEAAQAADLSSPLLESARNRWAKGCVINVSGGKGHGPLGGT